MPTEIDINEPFGRCIHDTVLKYQLKRNLEIGSWDGEGSTNCFVEAMKQLSGDLKLYCLEIKKERIESLARRYKDFPFVVPVWGSSLVYEDLVITDFEDIWNSKFNKIGTCHPKATVRGWFDQDVQQIKKAKRGFLSEYKDETWDSVLIDGGEFTGYSEFLKVKDKTKFLFLDDVHNAYKCNQIHYELLDDPQWTLLHDFSEVRNGASVFKKN